ncbi:hypothetical protein D3C77_289910 [compost metagenome]
MQLHRPVLFAIHADERGQQLSTVNRNFFLGQIIPGQSLGKNPLDRAFIASLVTENIERVVR